MKNIMLIVALSACTGSPNYWRTYTPASGTTAQPKDAIVQKATIAITDAGQEIETSSPGLVLSKWFSGTGIASENSRFRIRVSVDDAGKYEIAAMCQSKSGITGDWGDCGKDRPQFVIDLAAKVEAAVK